MAAPQIKYSKHVRRAIADSAKIGFEFSRQLDEGAYITIERRGDEITAANASLGIEATYEDANVTVWADVDEFTNEELAIFGGIDVVSDKKLVMRTPINIGEDILWPTVSDIRQDSDNQGNCSLLGILLNGAVVAETITITFTSALAYSVVGSVSLDEGEGRIDGDFTSTSEKLIINHEAWEGTPVAGDIITLTTEVHRYNVWRASKDPMAYLWMVFCKKIGEE